jgi:thiamine-monophosphate kinase
VGAEPLGIVVALSFSRSHDGLFIEKIAKGISNACQKLNSYVLGGDTNQAGALYLSGCALGLVPKISVMTRVGARPGDRLYLSGPAGLGSIFAFLRLTKESDQLPDMFYKPEARVKEGKIVREFASSCMDTSDGVIHTLDTLMRLNPCQFVLYSDLGRILHPVALEVCKKKSLPPWLTLASVHGEFELCFSVAEDKEKKFLQKAASTGWMPILIGEVASGKGVSIKTEKGLVPVDTASIRNISDTAGSDPQAYIARLLNIGAEVRV